MTHRNCEVCNDRQRPPHWSGCRVAHERWEFWQGHRYRLHDRIVYQRDATGVWRAQRLFP